MQQDQTTEPSPETKRYGAREWAIRIAEYERQQAVADVLRRRDELAAAELLDA